VYVKCLLGGVSWSEFLTLKMFLLTRYSKENKKKKSATPPQGHYNIPAAVKLKGKCVPLARMVMRNSKNTVAR
jgi:hypothetical protein